MTNIVIAFPRIEDGKSIKNILVKNGFHVSAVTSTGAKALELCDSLSDGVLVCGYKLTDMLYSQIKEDLEPGIEMLLLTSAAHIAQTDGDVVCVEMPIKIHDLLDTVSTLIENVESKRRKRRAAPAARDDASKEIIMQAKLLLMERNNLSEPEAHRYLQKTSMDSGNSLAETAQMVLTLYK